MTGMAKDGALEEPMRKSPGEFLQRHTALCAIAAHGKIQRLSSHPIVQINLREKDPFIFEDEGTGQSMMAHTLGVPMAHLKRAQYQFRMHFTARVRG
jgi:hypothetical protein